MAFNKDIPTSSTSLKASNPQILANQSQVQTALARNHQFEGTDSATQTGKHEAIELIEQADLGTGSEGLPIIGAQTVNAKAEFVFTDEDDNDIQLTSAGKSGSATTDLLANDATFSGTLGVTGVATIGDGSVLASSAAPTTDPMIANKKFVDDSIVTDGVAGAAFGAASESTTFSNGMIIKTGAATSTSDLSEDFDFAIPFPGAVVSVVLSRLGTNTAIPLTPGTISVSKFTVNRNDSITGDVDFTWIAIGY